MQDEQFLRTIQASNPVNASAWHIVSYKASGLRRLLGAGIDPTEQIVGLNYLINYRRTRPKTWGPTNPWARPRSTGLEKSVEAMSQ